MESPGAQVLNEIFNLNQGGEVDAAARRAEALSGQKTPSKVEIRIQNYLDRLQSILQNRSPWQRERARSLLRHMLYGKYIVTPEQIVEYELYTNQRIDHQQGYGYTQITPAMWETAYTELAEIIQETITQQTKSLDEWIDYLLSEDATYPDWLKYYSFRSILSLTAYDLHKKEFPERSTEVVDWTTLREFPELNQEALAYVLDKIERKYQGVVRKEDVRKLLQGENFAKLYAQAYEQVTPVNTDKLFVTDGQWVRFAQGSDPKPLVNSIEGLGTGWCTAAQSTARFQLQKGDIYIYYSLDEQNQPTIPRVAIRMDGNNIKEVRGIAQNQNLDPYIGEVAREKLEEFPNGGSYQKKTADMRRLTAIGRRINAGKSLTKDELMFLCEINGTIEGFGNKRDPRIAELWTYLNLQVDAPIALSCDPEEIAWSRDEVSAHIKAYIGPLFPGIFEELSSVEYLFTSFPDGKIARDEVMIGAKDRVELLEALERQGIDVSEHAKEMIKSLDFMPNSSVLNGISRDRIFQDGEVVNVVRLSVRDLGFMNPPTKNELLAKAQECGLELCSAEVGLLYRLLYVDQPQNELLYIGMKPVAVSGNPFIFMLGRHNDGLWLDSRWMSSYDNCNLDDVFVFCLRKND